MKTIFADFNNMDSEGYLRLNLIGTIQDMDEEGFTFLDGLTIQVSDGDLVGTIIVVHPGEEKIWRGRIIDGPWELRPDNCGDE